jgi:rubrerythrin
VEAKLDSYPIRVYKSTEKPKSETMSDITPCYVCPNCGFIELYASNPEKFI